MKTSMTTISQRSSNDFHRSQSRPIASAANNAMMDAAKYYKPVKLTLSIMKFGRCVKKQRGSRYRGCGNADA
jgi:hypothetical protein